MEELKKFMAALQEDKDLQKKLVDAVKALPKGCSEEESSKCLIALAKEAGYTVTTEDLAGLKDLVEKSNGEMELNVDEMAQAAGGFGAGFTASECDGAGGGITITVTTSGFGICFYFGGGNKKTACAIFGLGSDDEEE